METRQGDPPAQSQAQATGRRGFGRRALLSPLAIVALGLAAAIILVILAKIIFDESQPDTFAPKLAELLLQLALVGVLGAVVKLLIDSNTERKAKLDADNAKRVDLLRRVRAQHVKVSYAQRLIAAHNSGKTYTEQLRILMLAVPELEDVAEDIKSANNLFGDDDATVVRGVEGIVAYLNEGAKEYVRCHGDVDTDAKAARPLEMTIQKCQMLWVAELQRSAPGFPKRYVDALNDSKVLMRRHIYAD